eukprot:234762-Chlamydomonas_euryale.AAC.4
MRVERVQIISGSDEERRHVIWRAGFVWLLKVWMRGRGTVAPRRPPTYHPTRTGHLGAHGTGTLPGRQRPAGCAVEDSWRTVDATWFAMGNPARQLSKLNPGDLANC